MIHLDFRGEQYDPSRDYYFVLQGGQASSTVRSPEDLPMAVRSGEYEDALNYIRNADPSQLTVGDSYGQTALYWCAAYTSPMEVYGEIEEVWNALLEKLGREAVCSRIGPMNDETVLHCASNVGSFEFIKRVMQLEYSAELSEIEDGESRIPLHGGV